MPLPDEIAVRDPRDAMYHDLIREAMKPLTKSRLDALDKTYTIDITKMSSSGLADRVAASSDAAPLYTSLPHSYAPGPYVSPSSGPAYPVYPTGDGRYTTTPVPGLISPEASPHSYSTLPPAPEPLPTFDIPVEYLFSRMGGHIPRDVRIQAMRTAAFIKADHQLRWQSHDPAIIPAAFRGIPRDSDTHLFAALWRFLAATLMEDDE